MHGQCPSVPPPVGTGSLPLCRGAGGEGYFEGGGRLVNMRTLFAVVGIGVLLIAAPQREASAAGALQTVNLATNASGQSGYLAALIEAKGISKAHGLKINNLMMDFVETANALR